MHNLESMGRTYEFLIWNKRRSRHMIHWTEKMCLSWNCLLFSDALEDKAVVYTRRWIRSWEFVEPLCVQCPLEMVIIIWWNLSSVNMWLKWSENNKQFVHKYTKYKQIQFIITSVYMYICIIRNMLYLYKCVIISIQFQQRAQHQPNYGFTSLQIDILVI